MNSPQERIDEYFQRHDSAGVGRSPIRASEIRKLFTQTIAELEASCAQMREALLEAKVTCESDGHDQSAHTLTLISRALSTDCGKEFLERLNGLDRQTKDDKEYIEDLCAQLCKMEDALGFKNDCQDKDGAFVPTIGPWLERVRDLIAQEGELGDAKERLNKLQFELCREQEKLKLADEKQVRENIEYLITTVNKLEEQVWLKSKESHERLTKLEDRLKTAASLLRSAVYERTPLGDKWIDHFDFERQKAITEFLASVEGKP